MIHSRSRAISSVGERCLHTAEATGSIPVSPTIRLVISPFYKSFRNKVTNDDSEFAMTATPIQPLQRSRANSRLLKSLAGLFGICILTHCAITPPPSSLPPSATDLNLLGQISLCQTKAEARKSWLKPGSREIPWGNGTEHFQEIALPNKQGQWVVFNEDETVVGVITVFPDGLSLDNYPTLRQTLSQLQPAREFYLTSSQLLQGQVPDSATLYRTGKSTTTHQYYIRHRPGQDDELIMAVFVLDPYESLLDGSHPRFLSYLEASPSTATPVPSTPPSSTSQTSQEFLGLQQFARGEISLFASCGNQHPDIAQDAYQKAIHYGLPEAKQLAAAHHRLGLSFMQLSNFPAAKTAIENAMAIQPHAFNILNSYGTVLVNLKNIPAAIQAYEQALALQPAYTQARFNLAAAFESINPKRAIQEYETFLVLVEDNPDEAAQAALAKDKIKTLEGGKSR